MTLRNRLVQALWLALAVLIGTVLGVSWSASSARQWRRHGEEQFLAVIERQRADIQEAVDAFARDTGRFPTVLPDIAALRESELRTEVPSGSYKGPYIRDPQGVDGLPTNPLAGDSRQWKDHWHYSPVTGRVEAVGALRSRGKARP